MRCRECGTAKGRYEDPRDPPLDEGECLCAGCFHAAAEQQIEEHEQQIESLKLEISMIGKPRKKHSPFQKKLAFAG